MSNPLDRLSQRYDDLEGAVLDYVAREPRSRRRRAAWLVAMLLIAFLGIPFNLLLVAGVSYLWPAGALYVYGITLGSQLVYLLGWRTPWARRWVEHQVARDLGANLPPARARAWGQFYYAVLVLGVSVVTTGLFAFGFGPFLRLWSAHYGGFVAHGATYLDWAKYSFSWLVDDLLANITQIYGLGVSTIRPVTDTARGLVLGYNVVLETFVVVTLLSAFKSAAALALLRHPEKLEQQGEQ